MARPTPLEAPVTMAARSAGMGRYETGPAVLAPAVPAARTADGRREVDELVEVLVDLGEHPVPLRRGQVPVLDGLVELGGEVRLERRLQPVDGLAARRLHDVRERLAGSQLLAQL